MGFHEGIAHVRGAVDHHRASPGPVVHPTLEAVAYKGVGVFETLKEVARLVLAELKKG